MAAFWKKLRSARRERSAYCAAVVAAAGSATRMEGQDKILAPLGDMPVLLHTLRALESSDRIHEIVVVTREDQVVTVGGLCRDAGLSKVRKVLTGGANRTESVLRGIGEVSEGARLIAIQDGARPLVTCEIIDAAVAAAAQWGAAAPAVPVKDTVKEAADGRVTRTPDRSRLYAVQTPQVFDADLIRGALTKALAEDASLTDDCAAVERLGVPVVLTAGSDENIKITTPADLVAARAILEWRESR